MKSSGVPSARHWRGNHRRCSWTSRSLHWTRSPEEISAMHSVIWKAELGIPIIHVTHDIREALYLADEILPVVNGRVFHKWLLQFMLTAKEGFQCSGYYGEAAKESNEEIELPIRIKEYMR